MFWEKFKSKGVLICGLRGSGKTTLAKRIIQNFRALVYAENPNEYLDMPDNVAVFEWEDIEEDLDLICEKLLTDWKGKFDFFVIDGFDLIITHHLEKVSKFFNQIWIRMRHLGMGVIIISRRPQDIPARIWNSADYIIMFHYEIPSLLDMLKKIEAGLDEKVKNLGKHEFIIKDMSGAEETIKAKLKGVADEHIELD